MARLVRVVTYASRANETTGQCFSQRLGCLSGASARMEILPRSDSLHIRTILGVVSVLLARRRAPFPLANLKVGRSSEACSRVGGDGGNCSARNASSGRPRLCVFESRSAASIPFLELLLLFFGLACCKPHARRPGGHLTCNNRSAARVAHLWMQSAGFQLARCCNAAVLRTADKQDNADHAQQVRRAVDFLGGRVAPVSCANVL